MTEPINDYAESLIKARKHLNQIEHLLRLKRLQEAVDLIPSVETQCIRLRNYIYRESEK